MGFPDPPYLVTWDPDGRMVVLESRRAGEHRDQDRVYLSEDGRPFKRVGRVSTWVDEEDER